MTKPRRKHDEMQGLQQRIRKLEEENDLLPTSQLCSGTQGKHHI